jgi:diacylglycerol kinase (ATP)
VGGDGTVSETVNGFYDGDRPVAPEAELAIVSRGSGCDFIRTFGIPKGTDAALEVAAGGEARTVDLGRVGCTGPDGRPATRLYCNIASAGMTGITADRVNRSGKPLGATVAFAWGVVVTFVGHHNSRFHVSVDDRRIDQVCNNVIVGNCRYFAGGMKILPMADPGDGLLDVLVWGDVGKADLARNLHRLYRGTHVNHPKADFSRATRVVVETETPMPIEADGELPGVTPVTFEAVPAALRLRVPRAHA